MKAGDLNRSITVEVRGGGVDAAGQEVQTWTTFTTLWANVKGATGMASIRQSAPEDGVARELNGYSFRIRYRTDITPGMRVSFAGDVFDIKQVRHDYAGRVWTDLVAEAGNDG